MMKLAMLNGSEPMLRLKVISSSTLSKNMNIQIDPLGYEFALR